MFSFFFFSFHQIISIPSLIPYFAPDFSGHLASALLLTHLSALFTITIFCENKFILKPLVFFVSLQNSYCFVFHAWQILYWYVDFENSHNFITASVAELWQNNHFWHFLPLFVTSYCFYCPYCLLHYWVPSYCLLMMSFWETFVFH